MRWSHTLANGVMLAVAVTMQPAPPKESLLDKLLRIAGLSASPSQMRGPADAAAGNIWIVQVAGGAPTALTTDGSYRSPVFSPDGVIYALKDNGIVRLAAAGDMVAKVQNAPGVVKLVGFDRSRPDEIVVLLDESGGSPLGTLSLRTGTIARLPYDRNSADQQRLLAQVRAQDRVYGSTTVYTKTETKQGLTRPIEWIDVYIQSGTGAPRNISRCDGVSCVQPALSADGRTVAFVKGDE